MDPVANCSGCSYSSFIVGGKDNEGLKIETNVAINAMISTWLMF